LHGFKQGVEPKRSKLTAPVSFRGRLTLFLLLIVVLPMVVIAVLAARVADDASTGKADARLFAGIETANALYEREQADAQAAAEAMGADTELSAAILAGDEPAIQTAAAAAAREQGIEAFTLLAPDGAILAESGGEPFASAEVELTGQGGGGTLAASVTTEEAYLEDVRRLTGRDPAIYSAGQSSATLLGGGKVAVPDGGGADVDVAGSEQRLLTGSLPGNEDLRLALVGPPEEGGFFSSSPAVIAALIAFFALAFVLALGVMRALSGQVAAMLDAARGIGEGDFSREVPVVGRDEMAGLADEFNKMSSRLKAQMDQLRRQQLEIDRSVRRIGEAFASGLDRQGLLQIVAETAVSAAAAEYGLIALSGREGAEVSSGQAGGGIEDAVLAAEGEATRAGELIAFSQDGAHALSAPLRRIGDPGHDLGVMTVARTTRPFNETERDVFLYLIGQASASIENVALHELVSEQAVTDDLTGLSNNRAFTDVAYKEASRAERFSHPLSMLMLDIDDFKKVNDTYGHLQGDEVLRRVGRILRSESRGIDEPARYGGEEFVVALPETGTDGAIGLAERVRERIEREQVPFLNQEGNLRITASVGVASIPDSAADVPGLIAAADAALYAAKRGGKNRVEVAPTRPMSARLRGAERG
jgi:diguanylate cyclase (GGDEF)-like protein